MRKTSIFVSYRRDDTSVFAGRLYDRLSGHFGASDIFIDIDSIPSGAATFMGVVQEHIASSGVVLVLIGEKWTGLRAGRRRIDDPEDPVRVEVECALAQDVPIIPVYCDRKDVLAAEELPHALRRLSTIQGAFVETGRNFDHQERKLRRQIARHLWPTAVVSMAHRIRLWGTHNGGWLIVIGLALAVFWAVHKSFVTSTLPAAAVPTVLGRFDKVAFSGIGANEFSIARCFADRAKLVRNTDLASVIASTESTFDLFALSAQAFSSNTEALRAALAKGAKIRIVLMDPGDANSRSLQDYLSVCGNGGLGADGQKTSTLFALRVFKDLAEESAGLGRGSVEVRTWTGPYLNGFWVRDSGTKNGLAHVELSSYGRAEANPSLRFGNLAADVSESLQAQFNNIWQDNRHINVSR